MYVPVWLDDDVRELYYGGFCKQIMWAMLHYEQPGMFSWPMWRAFVAANQEFADVIALRMRQRAPSSRTSASLSVAAPSSSAAATSGGGDFFWLHDYHVALVPQLLRAAAKQSGHAVRCGLFLHAPFPTSEIFRCLPVRAELLRGLLSADLLGFQTYDYARHFLRSCRRILDTERDLEASPASVTCRGHVTSIGIFPIGVTPQRFLPDEGSELAACVAEHEAKHCARYGAYRIIVGKDTLEAVKGIPHKLRAIERLLAERPKYIGRIVYIQVTYPSSDEGALSPASASSSSLHALASAAPSGPAPTSKRARERASASAQKASVPLSWPLSSSTSSPAPSASHTPASMLQNEINELVDRINMRFGTLDYQPVVHFLKHLTLSELIALYRLADVGLVLPLRDGMNLTSHEFVVCQTAKCAPLVLSEFAGSARSLSGALLVNPHSTREVADALHEALSMSADDRALKQARLKRYVHAHTAAHWGHVFVRALALASASSDRGALCERLDVDALAASFGSVRRRILFLDYDGTLTPIVDRPELAVPPPGMVDALTALAADPRNVVCVLSGRDRNSLHTWLGGVPNLVLSAEHGCFIREADDDEWRDGFGSVDLSWRQTVEPIFEHYCGRTPGSFIERKRVNLVWHYRNADSEYADSQAKELLVHLNDTVASKLPVEVLSGKKAIEVRPVGIHKGAVLKRLLQKYEWQWALAIGDDRTDEDMFHALPKRHANTHSIFVGDPLLSSTSAHAFLDNPKQVLSMLQAFIGK
jgi:trehalose 6-phosphate synthase/phosphatase